ncbi:MAG: CoA activase, partial [Myxococcales bacterium]|nr:CoA activase [Myxococcales bacterium]
MSIGLDVGSTTVKRVIVEGADVVSEVCLRHLGRPEALARELCTEARRRFPGRPVGITGSIGVALAERLDARPVHEVPAVALAVRSQHPEVASVVELGGQDAKLLFLDRAGDAEMNDRCAAGTGATIDRIAARLGLAEDELPRIRLRGDLRVAAKCGVFAET